VERAFGRGDQRYRALEQAGGAEHLGRAQGRGRAVAFDLVGVALEHSRHFADVRGEDRRVAAVA
jgi:hypothetical protein